MEKYTIPEVNSEDEWLYLTGQSSGVPVDNPGFNPIKPQQILLVDVYR